VAIIATSGFFCVLHDAALVPLQHFGEDET